MGITLAEVRKEELEKVWRMQTEAFAGLLEKYRDYDMSPGAEPFEKVQSRYDPPRSTYYFILSGDEKVGVIRVIDQKDGSRKRISPLWIMPEYRGRGYAQQAIEAVERLYGPEHWSLDTILQEKGNLHLYEKMGYHRVGETEHINERMDIVFYEKN
ncbi:MAG: GNAT family N-acetyltransferase [Eubacterium sp.]|nr:GNAT family N-acetyltransferase [Eubacterium sp.]